MDHYLAVQRELNAGGILLGKFAGVATLTLFNQMVADYKAELQARAAAEADVETKVSEESADTKVVPVTETPRQVDYFEEIAPEGVYYEGVPK